MILMAGAAFGQGDGKKMVANDRQGVDVTGENCFAIIAGKGTTVDGSVLFGHNEDDSGEQMLNVYLDKHGVWNLNINSSFYAVNLPDEILSAYVCPSDMRWPSISYNIYGTTRLAWLLMKINGVRGAAIFREVRSGFAVKYLDMSRYVNKILSLIQENEGKVNG